MRRGVMKIFICRCVIVILPVPLLLLVIYLMVDPFMVIRDYDDYPSHDTVRAGINKGVVSLKHFEMYSDSLHYDSFILGSSVSIPYKCDVWAKYLPEDASIYHFDSSSESVRSLRHKIEYLKHNAHALKNVLIIVPPKWFDFKVSDSPVAIDHYRINPEVSALEYHWAFIKGFYDREFIKSYLYSKLRGKPVQVGLMPVIDTQPFVISAERNEETIPVWEDSIRCNPDEFYQCRPIFSDTHHPHVSEAVMTPEQERDLQAIAELLTDVDYHIIVGPMYNKEYMHPSSSQKMHTIFGDRYRDFSQSMQWTAESDTNYYDAIHYRHPIATMILDSIYYSGDCYSGDRSICNKIHGF